MADLYKYYQRQACSASFRIRDWLRTISNRFFLRPALFIFIMTIFGGYLGFYSSNLTCVLTFVPIVMCLCMHFLWGEGSTRQQILLICGAIIFGAIVFGFRYWKNYASELPQIESYHGNVVVCSSNCNDIGYKNIVVRLENGERVAFLTSERFSYGEKLEVICDLEMISSSGNPGDIDLKALYNKQGIIRSIKNMTLLSSSTRTLNPVNWLFRLGSTISNQAHKYWLATTDQQTADFLSAMVTGNDAYLNHETREDFTESNLAHLLVVSGAHVGYFSSTVLTVIAIFTSNRKKRLRILIVLLMLFGFVCGWSGSVSRSIVMYLIVELIGSVGRTTDRISSWSISALLILLIDPFAMFSSGVLLSFGATISICLFHSRVESGIRNRLGFLPDELICTISCFLCAQIGMLPVLISIGSSYSLLNVLIILVSGFPAEIICSMGLVVSVVSILIPIPFVRKAAFIPISGLIHILVELARLGAVHTSDRIVLSNIPIALILSFVGLFFIKVLPSGFRRKLTTLFSSITALCMVIRVPLHVEKECKVYFLDVGQGDSALISYCDINLLIDGGNLGSGDRIQSVMDYLDIDYIDMAFMSHLDIDHVGGVLELWNRGRIVSLYASYWGNSSEMAELERLYPSLPKSVDIIQRGDIIQLDDDFTLNCLWPSSPTDGGNEDSMVLLAEVFDTKVLFTGDINQEIEEQLKNETLHDIQVLKVAHHGSRFSTSEIFLQDKFIDAAVISVGYNQYGHPTKEVLNRLEQSRISCFRTDEHGCVVMTIDDRTWKLKYYFDS